MADLLSSLPLTHLAPAGHYGATGAGVRLHILDRLALASVSAARHQTAAAVEACNRHFATMLADQPVVSQGAGIAFLGVGPGRWLAIGSSGEKIVDRLENAFGATASVCDQSDGYVLFEIDGPCVRNCLSKGPSIDFSDAAFKTGSVATTSMAHIGLTIWRGQEADSYRIAVPASFAPSLLRLFIAGAAEFGLDIA